VNRLPLEFAEDFHPLACQPLYHLGVSAQRISLFAVNQQVLLSPSHAHARALGRTFVRILGVSRSAAGIGDHAVEGRSRANLSVSVNIEGLRQSERDRGTGDQDG